MMETRYLVDPPDPVVLMRVMLTIDPPLRGLIRAAAAALLIAAGRCQDCRGLGYTCEPYLVYLLTDDPMSLMRAKLTRRRRRRENPKVERLWRTTADLKTDCPTCKVIRDTLKRCEAVL